MKKKFLNSTIRLIEKNGQYTDEQLEIIAYGLEGVYLTFTKMIILFACAYVLGILKEFILLLVSFNIVRSQAFGLHATKSFYCLISSLISFIIGTLICKYVVIPFWILLLCSIICVVCLLLYAPADTHKRPLVNEKKRKRFKFFSVIIGVIYTVLVVIFQNSFIAKYLVVGMLEAVVIILPITYKIFRLPYNNYKTYCADV